MSHPKLVVEKNVLDLSLERIRYLYDSFDSVVVTFSGGKDSTVAMQLTAMVAEELGRLPVTVIHFDEEAIPPDTVEYLERVDADPKFDLKWYCVPVKHVNFCSRDEPFWFPWNPDKRDLWVRPLPEQALTETPIPLPWPHDLGGQRGVGDLTPYILPVEDWGSTALILGIRAQESFNRYRAVTNRLRDNWITHRSDMPHMHSAYPIYDWQTEDIWRAIREFGWDYNTTYDKQKLCGLTAVNQRICQPFGQQPVYDLWTWRVLWPESWDALTTRVPGASTASRYCHTALYGKGSGLIEAEAGWKAQIKFYLDRHPPELRRKTARGIANVIRRHHEATLDPIPSMEGHPLTRVSWKALAGIAKRGDAKGRDLAMKFFGSHVDTALIDDLEAAAND